MKDGCHIADAASPAGRCIALGIAETSQQGARAPIDLLDQFGQKNVVFFHTLRSFSHLQGKIQRLPHRASPPQPKATSTMVVAPPQTRTLSTSCSMCLVQILLTSPQGINTSQPHTCHFLFSCVRSLKC